MKTGSLFPQLLFALKILSSKCKAELSELENYQNGSGIGELSELENYQDG